MDSAFSQLNESDGIRIEIAREGLGEAIEQLEDGKVADGGHHGHGTFEAEKDWVGEVWGGESVE